MPSVDFWKGRRVLITGHTGFKGAWLWQWLASLGAEVAGFSLPPDTEPSLACLAGIADHPGSRIGDIRDRAALAAVFRDTAPAIVFHFAAQSLVRRSYRDPLGTFETNVLGTAYVLQSIAETPSVRAAVVATSDKCYRPASGRRPHTEEDPLGGPDPYSASKACAEIVVECWRRLGANAGSPAGVASVRAGNVIGGGDWAPDRLIPDCLCAWERGEPAAIRNPESVRPWQHVLDALSGYILLAERLWEDPPAFAEAWNFGPDESRQWTVRAVVDRLAAEWGSAAEWLEAAGAGAPEQPALAIDSTKARNRLGWRPSLTLDEALAWTVAWSRGRLSGEIAPALCASQIEQWMSRSRRP